jgi:hypothetical protein
MSEIFNQRDQWYETSPFGITEDQATNFIRIASDLTDGKFEIVWGAADRVGMCLVLCTELTPKEVTILQEIEENLI